MALQSKAFALHPGPVTSINDGDVHWITAPMLAKLYMLPPSSWIEWKTGPGLTMGRKWDDYTHLYPRRDGQYRSYANG